jgi:hypothetical protein
LKTIQEELQITNLFFSSSWRKAHYSQWFISPTPAKINNFAPGILIAPASIQGGVMEILKNHAGGIG